MIWSSLLEDVHALPGEENGETGIRLGDNELNISNICKKSDIRMKNETVSDHAGLVPVSSVLEELENILEKNQLKGTDDVDEEGNVDWQFCLKNSEE